LEKERDNKEKTHRILQMLQQKKAVKEAEEEK